MSGAGNEDDPLIEATKLDAKPALLFAAYVGANHAAGNLAPVRMGPSNPAYANVRTELDEAPSREPVQVEFQAILQTNSFAWPRHLWLR